MHSLKLKPQEQVEAWIDRAENEEKEFTLRLALNYALDGKGIYQHILVYCCLAICFPIALIIRLFLKMRV